MAANIDMSNRRSNIAFVGEVPWHGLGKKMMPGSSFDIWMEEAGLSWKAKRASVNFIDEEGIVQKGMSEIVYRSDTKKELGIVTSRYHIVQPSEVIEFYSDLVATRGWEIEVAGSLDGGKKIWALAKTDADIHVLGGADKINIYILLATTFDGTMATIGKFTSIRVVCQNTLSMSLSDKMAKVSVPHSRVFNAETVKNELGIYEASTIKFEEDTNILAKQKMSDKDAMKFIINILAGSDTLVEDLSTRQSNIIRGVFDLYKGKGAGSNLVTSSGTAWGIVNSITEYVDHHINSRSVNNRMKSAWFGQGEAMKNLSFSEALKIAA